VPDAPLPEQVAAPADPPAPGAAPATAGPLPAETGLPEANPPEAEALFLVTCNGARPGAQVVAGLAGVQAAFLRILWRGPRDAVPNDLATLVAALEDPGAWAAHGQGDGRPFWHWWAALPDGSVSVQRITEALPPDPRSAAEALARAQSLSRATAGLAECAAALRLEARPRGDQGREAGLRIAPA
jgi:hypothetical protein